MKTVKKEKGSAIICIEKIDANLLNAMKDFLRPELFSEFSLIHMRLNSENLIEIRNSRNVHYLRCMDFIPHADFMNNLDLTLHSKLWDKVVADYEGLHFLIQESVVSGRPFTAEQIEYLQKVTFLESGMVNQIIQMDFSQEGAYEHANELARCLKLQAQNYLDAIYVSFERKAEKAIHVPVLSKKYPTF